jgi:hypothetical protein
MSKGLHKLGPFESEAWFQDKLKKKKKKIQSKGGKPRPQKITHVRRQWFMPVILAAQEAEIRRITVQRQYRQIVRETLSQKNPVQTPVSPKKKKKKNIKR